MRRGVIRDLRLATLSPRRLSLLLQPFSLPLLLPFLRIFLPLLAFLLPSPVALNPRAFLANPRVARRSVLRALPHFNVLPHFAVLFLDSVDFGGRFPFGRSVSIPWILITIVYRLPVSASPVLCRFIV